MKSDYYYYYVQVVWVYAIGRVVVNDDGTWVCVCGCERITIHRINIFNRSDAYAFMMICFFHLVRATNGCTPNTLNYLKLNSWKCCCIRDVSEFENVHTTLSIRSAITLFHNFSFHFVWLWNLSSCSRILIYHTHTYIRRKCCAHKILIFIIIFHSNKFIAFFDGKNSRHFVVNVTCSGHTN